MKSFLNWLKEDRDEADKSEGHKKATLLASYMDQNDLLAGLMGQPTKSIVYRFLAIVDSLPAHEKLEFEREIQKLQMSMQGGQQPQEGQEEQPQEGQEEPQQ